MAWRETTDAVWNFCQKTFFRRPTTTLVHCYWRLAALLTVAAAFYYSPAHSGIHDAIHRKLLMVTFLARSSKNEPIGSFCRLHDVFRFMISMFAGLEGKLSTQPFLMIRSLMSDWPNFSDIWCLKDATSKSNIGLFWTSIASNCNNLGHQNSLNIKNR